MENGALGKVYKDGELIVRQGEKGDCMYVIQEGKVEVFQHKDNKDVHLAFLNEGDFFGEMAIFEKEERSASVRAVDEARILTIDQKNFLRRIHEDPSLAFHIVRNMSQRIRKLDSEHTRIKASDRRNWDKRPDELEMRNKK
jgi:CRP/FNR family cyclic AMP-dependent transcriptional regulator